MSSGPHAQGNTAASYVARLGDTTARGTAPAARDWAGLRPVVDVRGGQDFPFRVLTSVSKRRESRAHWTTCGRPGCLWARSCLRPTSVAARPSRTPRCSCSCDPTPKARSVPDPWGRSSTHRRAVLRAAAPTPTIRSEGQSRREQTERRERRSRGAADRIWVMVEIPAPQHEASMRIA
jgi:hypothetical protein